MKSPKHGKTRSPRGKGGKTGRDKEVQRRIKKERRRRAKKEAQEAERRRQLKDKVKKKETKTRKGFSTGIADLGDSVPDDEKFTESVSRAQVETIFKMLADYASQLPQRDTWVALEEAFVHAIPADQMGGALLSGLSSPEVLDALRVKGELTEYALAMAQYVSWDTSDPGVYLDIGEEEAAVDQRRRVYVGSTSSEAAVRRNGQLVRGLARRVHAEHNYASYRNANPSAHYRWGYPRDVPHRYVALWVLPMEFVDEILLGLPASPNASQPALNVRRRALIQRIEACLIQLVGCFPGGGMQPFREKHSVVIPKLRMHGLNRDHAAAGQLSSWTRDDGIQMAHDTHMYNITFSLLDWQTGDHKAHCISRVKLKTDNERRFASLFMTEAVIVKEDIASRLSGMLNGRQLHRKLCLPVPMELLKGTDITDTLSWQVIDHGSEWDPRELIFVARDENWTERFRFGYDHILEALERDGRVLPPNGRFYADERYLLAAGAFATWWKLMQEDRVKDLEAMAQIERDELGGLSACESEGLHSATSSPRTPQKTARVQVLTPTTASTSSVSSLSVSAQSRKSRRENYATLSPASSAPSTPLNIMLERFRNNVAAARKAAVSRRYSDQFDD